MIHPFFTTDMLWRQYVFSNVLYFSEV